jgi:predicted glutamine amidotransferase
MKKINSVLLVASFIVFFACNGSDTPRSVAEKFLDAMSSQDFEEARKYGTDETEKLLDMMSGFKKMTNDSSIANVKYEIIREKIEGEKATIFYTEEGREGELQLPLVKQEGKWKVLMSKETINSTDGLNTVDVGATSTDTAK